MYLKTVVLVCVMAVLALSVNAVPLADLSNTAIKMKGKPDCKSNTRVAKAVLRCQSKCKNDPQGTCRDLCYKKKICPRSKNLLDDNMARHLSICFGRDCFDTLGKGELKETICNVKCLREAC